MSTSKSSFVYNRLLFGVASVPGIFQTIMERISSHISGVVCFSDEIFVTGTGRKQHLDILFQVCEVLKLHGLNVSKNRSKFVVKILSTLGKC